MVVKRGVLIIAFVAMLLNSAFAVGCLAQSYGMRVPIFTNASASRGDVVLNDVNLTWQTGMNPDFSDVVFTDDSGANASLWSQTFSFWRAEGQIENNSYANFYIRVPSLPSGVAYFYAYYQPDSFVCDASDGYGTLKGFDDFDTNALNASESVSADAITFSNGKLILGNATSVSMEIQSVKSFNQPFSVRTRWTASTGIQGSPSAVFLAQLPEFRPATNSTIWTGGGYDFSASKFRAANGFGSGLIENPVVLPVVVRSEAYNSLPNNTIYSYKDNTFIQSRTDVVSNSFTNGTIKVGCTTRIHDIDWWLVTDAYPEGSPEIAFASPEPSPTTTTTTIPPTTTTTPSVPQVPIGVQTPFIQALAGIAIMMAAFFVMVSFTKGKDGTDDINKAFEFFGKWGEK